MDQIIGIIDSYAYWPLVRQVYVHAVGLPRRGQAGDPEEIAGGLATATKVLGALEGLVADASFLVGPALSLADLHLLPMIAYFTEAPEGAALLARHPRLDNWFARMKTRPSFAATDPR
jgi:glutathione S-transferase